MSLSAPAAADRATSRGLSVGEWGALAAEWDELARRVAAVPYLRPAWVAAWWKAFGSGRLELLTLRKNGRLVAVLPVIHRFGALRAVTNCHTPYSGILAEDAESAASMAKTLFIERPSRVSLEPLQADGGCVRACRVAAAEAGYRVETRTRARAPYLQISDSWPVYESRLGKNLVTDVARSWRRLARLGPVSMEIVTGGEHLEALLAEAFRVEGAGWKGEAGTAIRARPDTHAFYSEVASWAAAENMLRLFLLRAGDQAIAMYYALEEHGICHLLKGGFDQNYARYSPGKLLMHSLIARAHAIGLSRIEFHGDQEPYKLRWTTTAQDRSLLEAFSRSPAGQVCWMAEAWGRPAARRVLRLAGLRKPDTANHRDTPAETA